MENTRPNPILRLFPSLTDVAFLMPVLFLFLRMEGAPGMLEGDTGWHIRTGEWILQNGRVPDRDMFSFTKTGQPWFAWEWLWDVLFAWIHQHAGLTGVVFVSLLIICFAFALLYRIALRLSGDVFLSIGATLLAAMASTIHWLARPHLFTLLFVAVFYYAIERSRSGSSRWLWLLPPVAALWTNIHGGFVIGLVIVGAYLAGELAAAALSADQHLRQSHLRAALRYVAVLSMSLAATLINPYGYQLHVHVFRNLKDPLLFKYVNEWLSISFSNPVARYFEIMIVLGLMAAFWNLWRRRFPWAILLFAWIHFSLISARNIPIYVFLAAPILALSVSEWAADLRRAHLAPWLHRLIDFFRDLSGEFGQMDRVPRLHLISAVIFAFVTFLATAPAAPTSLRAAFDSKRYPDKAIPALLAQSASHRIFTDDEWGDYLIYRLYPHRQVFVDGRFDFYGEKFTTEDYLDLINAKYNWEAKLRKHKIDTILLSVNAALSATLKESANWTPVYDDGIAIVFRPRTPAVQLSSHFTATSAGEKAEELSLTRKLRQPNSQPTLLRRKLL